MRSGEQSLGPWWSLRSVPRCGLAEGEWVPDLGRGAHPRETLSFH